MIKRTLKFIGKTLLLSVAVSPLIFLANQDTIFTTMNPDVKTTFVINGEITEVHAAQFQMFMNANNATIVPARELTIIITSPGGSVRAGAKIIDLMHQSRSKIHTVADGIAFSMAASIFAEGDTRTITSHTYLLFHEVRQQAYGQDLLDDDFVEMADSVADVHKIMQDLRDPTNPFSLLSEEVKAQVLIQRGLALFKTKALAKLGVILQGLAATKNDVVEVRDHLLMVADMLHKDNVESIDSIHKKTGVSFSTLDKLMNNNKDNLVSPDHALDLGIATEVR